MYLYQLMGDKKADGPRDEGVEVLGSGGFHSSKLSLRLRGVNLSQ